MGRGPKPSKSKDAKPPVARKSPKGEGAKVRDLEKRLAESLEREKTTGRALTEALEQQTATSEILSVISGSPADIRPVLDAVARSATRLCDSLDAIIYRRDGDRLLLVAHHGPIPPPGPIGEFSLPLGSGTVPGRSVVDGRSIHILDLQAERDRFPEGSALARRMGFRTTLVVPLMREGVAIGSIALRRAEARLFTERQAALLQTFADQAVIAIENVRLFRELQTSNRELTTALDKQTATSDILAVISRSQTDVQPVFDAILASAVRLLGANGGTLTRIVGDQIELAAFTLPGSEEPALRAAAAEGSHAQVVRERAPVNIADMQMDPRVSEDRRALARAHGFRSLVAVPLLRQDEALGAIAVTRPDPGGFAADEIALLQTFADQAVIAIENVRLFTELQEKNRALTQAHAQVTESLEQQTATSEILRVISRSPTDVQPVFDTIAQSAVRLCDAVFGAVFRLEGGLIHVVAITGVAPEGATVIRQMFPIPVAAANDSTVARAIAERGVVHVLDTEAPQAPRMAREGGRAIGFQSQFTVPMLRGGEPIGAVNVSRREPGPFSETQIKLLQTFADQAVIAIENVRLFTELQTSNRELTTALDTQTATGDILRVISRSQTDVQPVFDAIVTSAVRLLGAFSGALTRIAGEQIELAAITSTSDVGDAFLRTQFPQALSSAGPHARTIRDRAPLNIADAHADPRLPETVHANARVRGYRSQVVVPLLRHDEAIGTISLTRAEPGAFTDYEISLRQSFADQAVIAIQNVRLFKELEAANRELAGASQHKSEFLANMSHELRTPLNAIIGFSEVLSEKMFGELNEKQEEYSKDIHASGQHLLSLINDILDLSKIEAGRMELELSDFHLPTALDSALTLVRERAGRRSIALHLSVDERLGQIQGDERKVRQVVLNLLSNAIKFTPEGGRIEVVAAAKDGAVEVSVRDTGIGIAPEDHEAVFQEFRQVGTADKKAEGTGLGLTLCRKFIELHGGRIWVKSQLGAGSTFTFTIPTGQ
jgi:signal transduction histidine kinase